MAMVLANDEADYSIKPEASTPALNTSDWPLLLKSYDKCNDESCDAGIGCSCADLNSTCPYWSFYPNSLRMYSSKTRPQIVYQFWCDQPRQAFEPVKS